MPTRRDVALGLCTLLAAPAIRPARAGSVGEVRTAATGLSQLHAIMVQRGDDLLVAEAPRGPGLAQLANIKSVSKSVLSLMLGTAIERGEIADLSTRLGDIAPALVPADATEGAADLTMRDLVTLRAGLESTSGRNYGAWVASRNWVAYALRQPRVAPAGGRMIYSTGTTHVLGAALSVATGESLLSLARSRLGQGLRIEIPPWTRDPQGYFFGGNEMALTPQGMLRLALLIRDNGVHNGRQVVNRDWVRASQNPATRSPFSGLSYGLGWFLSSSGWTIARGYGGQVIATHRDRSLAVAITSDPVLPARSQGHFGDLMRLLDGPVLALG
ncbi:serine hydrolase [Pararhodobacter sp. SW119]|uniref:serine hydrolase domain-containing protein n=1 Tax=Pararhodobacter sp. SW119 TaxID=2780075 RepID=UPI001AE06479|nr:serine hydrolase [Pararhodobacter sp. SW119]